MATDTVPAAVPGPPEPPGQTATSDQDPKGFLASMVAPVEPARPTFDLVPTAPVGDQAGAADGALDRSAPGSTSAAFRDATEEASKGNDPAGASHKKSIWKELWLAAAKRWAKGGGTANKRLDLEKAKAQANQVKENRTTTVMKSGGLPVRNSGGSGSGIDKGSRKSDGNSSRKSPPNSSGNRTNSGGRGAPGAGSGGGRGTGGGSGSNGAGTAGRKPKDTGSPGKGGTGSHGAGGGAGRGKDSAGGRKNGPDGGSGASGKGSPGGSGGKTPNGSHTTDGKNGSALAPTKDPAGKNGKQKNGHSGSGGGKGATGAPGPGGKNGTSGAGGSAPGSGSAVDLRKRKVDDAKAGKGGQPQHGAGKSPLEKSRETGHGDGTKARRAVDHVKAYVDGTRDGWDDEKTKNSKEHQRLDKAHDTHKPTDGRPQGVIVTEKEDDGVTTDIKPLTVQNIDANTLTLGTDGARTSVGRRELRNFKQYERKLETKETVLQKISEACAQLANEAETEAKDCQQLAEQAKSVNGGEKLGATLSKLAEAAKNQAAEADTLAKQAKRAAEMCKVVLTNIQTRYAPLYKAVVDSDETKPAELRFYNDKGSYAHAA